MKSAKQLGGLSLMLFCVAWSAAAHDQYLLPDPLILEKSGESELRMFLQDQQLVWFRSETVSLKINGPTGTSDITEFSDDLPVLSLDRKGTYVIAWESVPNYIQIDAPTFQKYIQMEGYTNVIEARRTNGRIDAPGKERYSRYLKTFLQLGVPRTEHYARPMGHKIEIIPLTNPYSLELNNVLDVKVLYDGKPLPNRRVMATYDSYSRIPENYAQTVVSDANGIARFLITNKGTWMIRTNQIIPISGDPQAEWESFWANATFRVE